MRIFTNQSKDASMREVSETEFSRILRIVRAFVSSELDAENVAGEIWLESLRSDHEPTRYEIKLRCFDAIRRWHREDKKLRSYKPEEKAKIDETFRLVEDLIDRAGLNATEKAILVQRFYNNRTLQYIADDFQTSRKEIAEILWTTLDKLRRAKRNP